jgi:hypothetical protein
MQQLVHFGCSFRTMTSSFEEPLSLDSTVPISGPKGSYEMPVLGFGTWQLEEKTEDAVFWALKAGYRLIDTAQCYK